ncbi:MAG: hypothetical protein K2R98_04245 [Gemmataceae bacterium]|nr:hypothetical protein [Gemmataceae bacterium]
MKRFFLFTGLLCLAVGSALVLSVFQKNGTTTASAADPCPNPPKVSRCSPPASATYVVTRDPSGNAALVQELIGVLNETKSREVLIMTFAALAAMGPDAKPAIPAILRSAERCDLLRGVMEAGKDSEQREFGKQVLLWLMMIVGKDKEEKKECCGAACPAPVARPATASALSGP